MRPLDVSIRLVHQVVDNLSRSHDFLEITAVIQHYQCCCIINYIIVLVEAVFVAPRSVELGIAT